MRTEVANARLADGRVVDIVVDAGLIGSVTPVDTDGQTSTRSAERVDVAGWLLLPAMAEPHAHLDKALTAERVPNPDGDLPGAIEAWIAAAQAGTFTHGDMVARIRTAIDKLLLSGVTAIRSHINCGANAGIGHLVAAREVAADYRGLVDIELVALTHPPMVGAGSDPNRRALDEAIEFGVDLVGGSPHLETDGAGSVACALAVAAAADLGVDLHVDEILDPSILTLRDLARAVIDTGFERRVAASHCVTLGMQTPDVQAAVAAEVAEAGIAVITLPQTNLFLQGRGHPTGTPRGLTAIAALREAGVLVAAGADNVQDPFNPVGRSDPLETAALLVMAGHVLPDDAYELVSNDARRAIGLPPVRFDVGDPADFVAIDAPSIRAAIADAPADRKVFKSGRLVTSSATTRTIHR